MAQLAAAPAITNLRYLHLGWNQIGEAGAAALADSPHLDRLAVLILHDNPLCQSLPAMARLRERFGKAVTF
jgi:hypothetical protein